MTWRITTASRLHFGLFSLPQEGRDERHFGGCGLMIRDPGLELQAAASEGGAGHTATGPLAERVLEFAGRATGQLQAQGHRVPALHLEVLRCPPQHHGLGVGTQLGLATAQLVSTAAGLQLPVADLTQLTGRGLRSGIGAHGFFQGGFLVEGGKRPAQQLAPLLGRYPFPDNWRVVVILPRQPSGLHGPGEKEAFAHLASAQQPQLPTDQLCRLVLLGMLPALIEEDLPTFGEALHEFNRRVGEVFASVQGGPYAPGGAEVVEFVRGLGVAGVGQSSWGPALFAICLQEEAETVSQRIRARFGLSSEQVLVTAAVGARLEAHLHR